MIDKIINLFKKKEINFQSGTLRDLIVQQEQSKNHVGRVIERKILESSANVIFEMFKIGAGDNLTLYTGKESTTFIDFNPNSSSDFLAKLINNLFGGYAVIYVNREPFNGKSFFLEVLDNSKIKIEYEDTTDKISKFTYNNRVIEEEDYYIILNNSTDGRITSTYSVRKEAEVYISIYEAILKSVGAISKQGLYPALIFKIIQSQGQVNKGNIDKIKNNIAELIKESRAEPLVVSGDLELIPNNSKDYSKELEVILTKVLNLIFLTYTIPKSFLGDVEGLSNRSVIDESTRIVGLNVIEPLLRLISNTFNKIVVNEFKNFSLTVKWDTDIGQLSVEQRYDLGIRIMSSNYQGTLTPNEVRRIFFELEDKEGADDLTNGNMNPNTITTNSIENRKTILRHKASIALFTEEIIEKVRVEKETKKLISMIEKRNQYSAEQIDKLERKAEKIMSDKLISFFEDKQEETLRIYSRTPKELRDEKVFTTILDSITNDYKFAGQFMKIIEADIKELVFAGVRKLEQTKGLSNKLNYYGKQVDFITQFTEVIEEQVKSRIETVTIVTVVATYRKTFNELFIKNFDVTESPLTLSRRVRKEAKDLNKFNADRIARTEVGNAVTTGIEQRGLNDDDIGFFIWNSTQDGHVRLSHQINGQVIKKGERFSNGLRRPFDTDAPLKEFINCRCALGIRTVKEQELLELGRQ